MFDSLSNFFAQNQQRLEQEGIRPGQMNAAGTAGLLMASGMMPQDAYVQAARMTREQEMANLEKQKYEQQQLQLQTAAQILQNGGGLADMLAAGISNPAILGAIPQPQWVGDATLPGGGRFITAGAQGGMGAPSQGGQQMQMGGQEDIQSMPQWDMQPRKIGYNDGLQGDSPAERQAAIDIKKRRAEETDKWQQRINEQAKSASNVVTNIGRVKEAIPKMFTGTGASAKYELNKALGINKSATVATEKFNSAVSQVIDDLQSQKTKGVTDAGRDLIIATKPQLEGTPKGSMSIANAIEAHAKGQTERAKAADEWLRAGGDPRGFDVKWLEFEETYPFITENEKTGLLDVHESNIQKWRDVLFGGESGTEADLGSSNDNPFLQELRNRRMME